MFDYHLSSAIKLHCDKKQQRCILTHCLLLVGKSGLLLEKLHCFKNSKGTVTLWKTVVKSVASLPLVCFSPHMLHKAESSLPRDQKVLFSLG